MQVSVENTSNLERRVNIQIPASAIEGEISSRIQQMSRSAKIKGFRPGKVPLSVVQKMYGQQIQAEVIQELSSKSYQEAIQKESLQPATQPNFDIDKYVSGQDYAFSATFEIFPDFELKGLDSLTLSRPVANITEADIDAVLEKLQRQRADYTEVKRPAQKDDEVELSISGEAVGDVELPEEVTKERTFSVVLGAENNWKPLADVLEGASDGEEKIFEHTFPEGESAQELSGQTIKYTVHVNSVKEPSLPEVNDEFIAGFGLGDKTLEEFRAEIKKDMQKEAARVSHSKVREQVVDALVDANDFELPSGLVEDEAANIKASVEQRSGPQAVAELEKSPEKTQEAAERSVRIGLIFRNLIRDNQLTPTREQMKAKIDEIASQYEDPRQVAQYYMSDEKAYQQVHAIVIDEIVVDWIVDQAKVEAPEVDFQTLVNDKAE